MGESNTAMEQQILNLMQLLRSADVDSYDRIVVRMAQQMSPEGKRDLSRLLRSPRNAIGSLKGNSLWPEVEAALAAVPVKTTGE